MKSVESILKEIVYDDKFCEIREIFEAYMRTLGIFNEKIQ
jgi:hypothetical protein